MCPRSLRLNQFELLEPRRLLSCSADYCEGGWRVNVTGSGGSELAVAPVQYPGGVEAGTAVEFYYELSASHVPLSSVLLTNGFYRQASPSGPLTTSFRGFQFYSSSDVIVDTLEAQSITIAGVDPEGNLSVEAVFVGAEPTSGDTFQVVTSYVLAPPRGSFTSTTVTQTVTNIGPSDVRPAWQGHRDLEEQWRLYGVSSMFVATDYSQGLPAWYDTLDPSHKYVGNIDDASPANDAYSVNGGLDVPAHDTAFLSADGVDVALAHEEEVLEPVEVPFYSWFDAFVFYRERSNWLAADHAFDPARNHRVELISASGLVNSLAQLAWSARYARNDPNMVDGDNLQVTVGMDEVLDNWPASASQELTLRLISGAICQDTTTAEVTDQLDIQYQRSTFNRRTGEQRTDAVISNISTTGIQAPLWLVISSISVPGVTLANPDGTTSGGSPYVDLTAYVGDDGVLSPAESSSAVALVFHNPARARFAFVTTVLVHAAPRQVGDPATDELDCSATPPEWFGTL